MASLDSAKGPSATIRPCLPETILPCAARGWPALAMPCSFNFLNQAVHWPTTSCISSSERPLCQSVPRNNNMYCVSVCVSLFIISFVLLFEHFRLLNYTTNKTGKKGQINSSFPFFVHRWNRGRFRAKAELRSTLQDAARETKRPKNRQVLECA